MPLNTNIRLDQTKDQTNLENAIANKHSQNTDTQLDSGVVAIDGSDNLVLTQNSIAALTSLNAGAVVNTLYLKEGKAGIGKIPSYKLDIDGSINIKDGSTIKFDGTDIIKRWKVNNAIAIGTSAGADKFATCYFGHMAGYLNTGAKIVAIGKNAGYTNSKDYATMVGYEAGFQNTGTLLTAIGPKAGYQNIGDSLVLIGWEAGKSNTGGSSVIIGNGAGISNVGVNVVLVGHMAGYLNTKSWVTAVGYGAGQSNIADYVTAIGGSAGASNSGGRIVSVGYRAGVSNTGAYSVFVGYKAGELNTGGYSTIIGYEAGLSNTGTEVVGFGYQTLRGNSGSNVVALGYQAGLGNAVNNQFIVKHADVNATPLIQGDFLSGNIKIAGELKIKVYAQAAEPTLSTDEYMAIWKDTDDVNRVYLLFRRGVADQVAVELV